jgi:hypothetical protein
VPAPGTTFGFILATMFGAVFHLVVGGDIRRLALFLLSAWVGFGLGHMLGAAFGINMLNVGTLRVLAATIGALVALAVAHILTSDKKRRT